MILKNFNCNKIFEKNILVFKNKIFADPWLDSEKIEFNDMNND